MDDGAKRFVGMGDGRRPPQDRFELRGRITGVGTVGERVQIEARDDAGQRLVGGDEIILDRIEMEVA